MIFQCITIQISTCFRRIFKIFQPIPNHNSKHILLFLLYYVRCIKDLSINIFFDDNSFTFKNALFCFNVSCQQHTITFSVHSFCFLMFLGFYCFILQTVTHSFFLLLLQMEKMLLLFFFAFCNDFHLFIIHYPVPINLFIELIFHSKKQFFYLLHIHLLTMYPLFCDSLFC